MTVLMCRPEFFGIEYEINPWMHVSVAVDRARATAQWETLRDVYARRGVSLQYAEPVSGLPDMVFTANAAVVWGRRAVISRFRHPQRCGEEPHWRRLLTGLGYEVHEVPAGHAHEGAGDALFLGEHLFQGWGFRTDLGAHAGVAAALGVESTSLELADPRFYHLDTCFCPLDDRSALVVPAAFTAASLAAIRRRVGHVIEVDAVAAAGFACNALPHGDTVISSVAIEALRAPLRAAGFDVLGVPVDEFLKSGGGVRCLSLPLDAGLRSGAGT
ncbi:MAG: dimethylarginine dimethylaminohydrolase family protein [Candidatus Dormibacteria bacterium]